MKETPRSIRLYFGFCSVLQLVAGLSLAGAGNLVGMLLGSIFLGMAVLFVFIVVRLPKLLVTTTTPVTIALGGSLLLSVAMALESLREQAALPGVAGRFVFGVLIIVYLYRNVQRLAAEAQAAPAAR
jgi:hypothetical protein